MNKAKSISSAICYLSGVCGLTRAQDISDIAGVIVSIISAVSMIVCLIINIISLIRKASSDGHITPEEYNQILKQLEDSKKEVENLKSGKKD